jgi:hypothetical protein
MAHEGIADQRSLEVVTEQLTTLQNGQAVFRGDLFPGQHIEWTVTGRDAERNKSGGRERNWETSVTFTLPNLGPVTAVVSLSGRSVTIALRAENGDTLPVLETGRPRLIEQLEGAGLTPTEVHFTHVAA